MKQVSKQINNTSALIEIWLEFSENLEDKETLPWGVVFDLCLEYFLHVLINSLQKNEARITLSSRISQTLPPNDWDVLKTIATVII